MTYKPDEPIARWKVWLAGVVCILILVAAGMLLGVTVGELWRAVGER